MRFVLMLRVEIGESMCACANLTTRACAYGYLADAYQCAVRAYVRTVSHNYVHACTVCSHVTAKEGRRVGGQYLEKDENGLPGITRTDAYGLGRVGQHRDKQADSGKAGTLTLRCPSPCREGGPPSPPGGRLPSDAPPPHPPGSRTTTVHTHCGIQKLQRKTK